MPRRSEIKFPHPYFEEKLEKHIEIKIMQHQDFADWVQGTSSSEQSHIIEQGFKAKAGEFIALRDNFGAVKHLIFGVHDPITHEDGANLYKSIKAAFSKETLEKVSFSIKKDMLDTQSQERLYLGWGWASYRFDGYKKPSEDKKYPQIIIPDHLNKKRITAFAEAIFFTRDLINIPANDMGPEELENAAKFLTKHHKCKLKVIREKDLINKNFPMILAVGQASVRRPRLLDFTWGDESHPRVTIVGKGVCFDTGGLDIKPSQYMITMKKDMGGAAHTLGLAHLIMSLNLPIRLRVLIPAVENSIDGNAFRPSDILQTRKGITVEIGNTDAEGRLVLADAITYACEEEPELLIDFATLTGAARVALGADLPGLFSNNGETAQSIQKLSQETNVDDPVWNLPLWKPYRKELDSSCADISSTGGKAGATTAALFLNEFIEENVEWVHVDCYAWRDSDTPTNPKGGADTGLRTIFAYLEDRYSKQPE